MSLSEKDGGLPPDSVCGHRGGRIFRPGFPNGLNFGTGYSTDWKKPPGAAGLDPHKFGPFGNPLASAFFKGGSNPSELGIGGKEILGLFGFRGKFIWPVWPRFWQQTPNSSAGKTRKRNGKEGPNFLGPFRKEPFSGFQFRPPG